MKILITSGGTKIPIDTVRDITNMSKGTFGSKIAIEFLKKGQEVYFFHAEGSKTPFKVEVNMLNSYSEITGNLLEQYQTVAWHKDRYKEMTFKTFVDYKERLERLIKFERPDVVMLTAAVSDYGVENPHKGKIRSNDLLQIQLTQLPKIIYYIKEWLPSVKLVGFKLLVDSRDYELIEAAQRSIADNKCDMIVANDLSDIKDGKHKVHLVFPNQEVHTYKTNPEDSSYLARMVVEHTMTL